MSKVINDLYSKLKKINCRAKIVSTDSLSKIIREIQELHDNGFLEDLFFKERLSWINSSLMENQNHIKSIIVVAVPRPQTQAIFNWKGKKYSIIIPPTYTGYEQTRDIIEDTLTNFLKQKNFFATRTIFPLKIIAVQSGLGEYGKNNICYVRGMGSFHQLVAMYSDLPWKEPIKEPKMMDICNNCNLCQKACPTKAIPKNRFLLQAERCLTYHNEKKGSIPFPGWIEKTWHNCIVGCMYCQKICPVNRNFINWIGTKEIFFESETRIILGESLREDLSSKTLKKLENLNLADYLDSLSRNLKVFFK